jgi:hypothetical protein
MGRNLTGKPQTKDYSLGRGIVYAALLDANGKPKAYRDLGNCPNFTTTLSTQTLEHQSSRQGLKITDKEVTISQKCELGFSLDEVNDENVAFFFAGEEATPTNGSIVGINPSGYQMVANGNLESGRWYDLVNQAGNRCYNISSADLSIVTAETVPVALVKDTDYEVDEEMGRIFTMSTSAKITTAIAAGKGLNVTLAANAGAGAVQEVRALTKQTVTVAIKFISQNPAYNNAASEYEFHQVNMKAEGDLALIGDNWEELKFKGTAETNSAYPSSPTMTKRTTAKTVAL